MNVRNNNEKKAIFLLNRLFATMKKIIKVNDPRIGEIILIAKSATPLLRPLNILYIAAVTTWKKGGAQKGSSLPNCSNSGNLLFSAMYTALEACQHASPDTWCIEARENLIRIPIIMTIIASFVYLSRVLSFIIRTEEFY